jgi:MYXO-CTERM domain-containing protein
MMLSIMTLPRAITVVMLLFAGSLAAFGDTLLMPQVGRLDVAALETPQAPAGDAAGWVDVALADDSEATLFQTDQTPAPDSYGALAFTEASQIRSDLGVFQPACVVTPEPASLLLAAAGVAVLAGFRKRRA